MKRKILETEEIILEVKNGVLNYIYKKGVIITLSVAQKMVADRMKFTNGKTYPAIAFDLGLVSLDKEARKYLSSGEANECVSAVAFVSDTLFNENLVNFFIKTFYTTPKIPTRLFKDKTKALLWLEQFKE